MKNHRKKIKQYRGRMVTLQTNQTNGLHKIKNLEFTLSDLKQQIAKEKLFQEKSQKRMDDLTGDIENKKNLSKERTLQEKSQKRIDDCSDDCGKYKKKINKKQLHHTQLNDELIILQQLTQEITNRQDRDTRRYLFVVSIVAVFAIVVISFSFFQTVMVGTEYIREFNSDLKTGHVIQNLKGDTIDTWASWQLIEGDSLKISVSKKDGNFDVIKNAILSKESIQIDDSLLHKGPKGSTSTYFLGWSGALENAAQVPTKLHIPVNLEFLDLETNTGDIVIDATNLINTDGYSGYTTSITDEGNNQILKSKIIIYNSNNLSESELTTIVRHEFGHALGLIHSTAPEDLMAPIITTNYPYISECDIDAIRLLYDDGKTSKATCRK